MSEFLSKDLKGLEPYVPGEQPQDRRYVKLNTNESPFPPAPGAVETAKAQAEALNLYSDPVCAPLKRAAAAVYGLEECNVTAGNGSDENLAHIFRAFLTDKGVAFPDITYGFYPVLCSLLNMEHKTVPLKEDFSIDISDYENIDCPVCIANPNAQTGMYLPPAEIEKLLLQNAGRLVIIDEAYIDFGGTSCAPLVNKYKNLIVVQTMSKSRSLAGARVGFVVADSGLISDLKKIKYSFHPYNVNTLSMLLAKNAVEDDEYFKSTVARIVKTRGDLTDGLRERGFYVLPSSANFVLARTPKMGGEELYLQLKSRGVLVRHFSDERIKDFVRITVGTDGETAELLKAIDGILKETK